MMTGSFLALKIVTPVFVNKAKQSELHNFPMERRPVLLRLGKRWAWVAWDDKLGSGIFTCLFGLKIQLLGS